MHTEETQRARVPSGDPVVGRLVDGRYQVGHRVARGGMASVYQATDIRLDRTVALKVMHAQVALAGLEGDDFTARFVREARAAARLSHPHVVAVYDQGEDDGIVYLAMELVVGHTLRDTVTASSPMSPRRALALLEPVLSALAAAHRAGLVHRDVKPENVLIGTDGNVKVADFGLAKAVSADTQHTTQGVLIGTVSYLAPELVVEGSADARADVYAAGVMLYEMLTGAKPHEGESPIQVAYKHVHRDVPPPSRLVPSLPSYVDALVARATARDRDQRSADAGVLLHQLHRVAQALAEGVEEDRELTEDLTPARLAVGEELHEQDSSPVILAPAELARPRVGPRREHTVTWDEHDGQGGPARRLAGPVGARPDEPARAHQRRRRTGPLLALALVAALGAAAGAYWFGWARYTAAPGVIGMSAARADARLQREGLTLEINDRIYSETVPAGAVMTTDPAAGSRIVGGGAVEAVVSLGKERYDVPDVAGEGVDAAQDALVVLTLVQDETVERWSRKVPEGTVVATRPAAGTTLRPGASVDLVVSRGPRPVPVGDWVGDSLEEARGALTERGLTSSVASTQHDDTVPEGAVISQQPSSGTLVRGQDVSFVVSTGPELVEVPGVTAYGLDAATAKLEEAGFSVEVENDGSYIGLGFVVRTDPGDGEMVPAGSVIVVYIV